MAEGGKRKETKGGNERGRGKVKRKREGRGGGKAKVKKVLEKNLKISF